MEKLKILESQLLRTIKEIENEAWVRATIIIQFPPFVNKGYTTLPLFLDATNIKIRLIPRFDDEFNGIFFDLVKDVNSNGSFNEVLFTAIKNEKTIETTICISFNSQIEDEFQSQLPKSKRGKTTPWWKSEI